MSKIFRGIVATGASRKQAVSNYRLLARGKNVQAFAGGKDDVFIAALSADTSFNPTTGNLDMSVVDGVLDQFDFASNSATADVNYTVCNSCQSHIIADDATLVSHCTECGDEVQFPEGEVSESDDDEDAVDAALDDADEDGDYEADIDEDGDGEDSADAAEDDLSEDDAAEDDSAEDDTNNGDDESAEDDSSESGDDEEDDGETIDLTDDDPETPVDDDIAEAAAALDDEDLDDTLTVVSASYDEAVASFTQAKFPYGVSKSSTLDAHYVVCNNCDCHIISESAVYECPSCSGDVDEPSEDDAELEIGDVDLDAEDTSESEDLAILDEDKAVDDDSEEADPDDDAEDDTDNDDDDEDAEDDEESSEDEASESSVAEIKIDTMVDGIPDDAKAEDLDVSFSNVQRQPMWTLYHKGQPVATAVASNAGDKADIFQREAFGHAFLKSVSAGVPAKKVAADFGFRGFDMTAAVSAAVSRQAQEEIASHSADAQAQVNAIQENLMQALSTAAMGINRGFFEGVTSNPLRDSLMQALSMAGVANPATMLDRAFAESADAYHGLLFNQAIEILRHPREVQESMSSAVQRINMVSASAASSVHTRVGSFGTPAAVPTPTASDVQASQSSQQPQGGAISAAMNTFR